MKDGEDMKKTIAEIMIYFSIAAVIVFVGMNLLQCNAAKSGSEYVGTGIVEKIDSYDHAVILINLNGEKKGIMASGRRASFANPFSPYPKVGDAIDVYIYRYTELNDKGDLESGFYYKYFY